MLAALDTIPAIAWLLLVCVLAFGWWMATTRTRRHNHRRGVRARSAESAAERLLERHGYRVHDRQLTGAFDLEIDGVPVQVRCRADLFVSRRRRWYIAEVKTGHTTVNPRSPATRRQLLEYHLAFDVDGVLLVDMEQKRIVTVGFPHLPAR